MTRFQVCVCEFVKNRVFRNFYLVDDGDVFIIVFKSVDTAVDNRENLHMKSIKQAVFCDLNPFCRKVIH